MLGAASHLEVPPLGAPCTSSCSPECAISGGIGTMPMLESVYVPLRNLSDRDLAHGPSPCTPPHQVLSALSPHGTIMKRPSNMHGPMYLAIY